MVVNKLLEDLQAFISGQTDIETFSFEFEEALYNASGELKKENRALYELFNEDLPELCANYEPDPEQRAQYPDVYFDEFTVRERVAEIYAKAGVILGGDRMKLIS